MGSFRPARVIEDSHGVTWELYTSRSKPQTWKPGTYDLSTLEVEPRGFVLEFILTIPMFLFMDVLWPLLRFTTLMPFNYVAGRRSKSVWIEAIDFGPPRETRTWKTTPDHLERVLNIVANGLAAGHTERPVGAVYGGSRTG